MRAIAALTRVQRKAAVDDVDPYWQALNERVAACPSDEQKFAVLADAARASHLLPPLAGDLPERTLLRLGEQEVMSWVRGQAPRARGRMLHVLQGANVEVPWSHDLLQREGRFSPRWQQAMCDAARSYVLAVAADVGLHALLKAPERLDGPRRERLAAGLVRHASKAWGTPPPRVVVHERGMSMPEGDMAACMLPGPPVTLAFRPLAFDDGDVELMSTVFHEQWHAVQVLRMTAGAALDIIDEAHADILALSMRHQGMRHLQPGDRHALYRYGSELEREAHLGGLQAALLAAAWLPWHAGSNATLSTIGRHCGSRALDAVRRHLRDHAGLQLDEFIAAAAPIPAPARATLLALQSRGAAEVQSTATFERMLAEPSPPAVERAWQALLSLPRLRDDRDRSGLLAQALFQMAPEVFLDERADAVLIAAVVENALDARGSGVREHALARLLGGRDLPRAQRRQALTSQWARHAGALARHIVVEAARMSLA
ncbi:MAG TPA: hypothetical protein VF169_11105 [Albitalea sp.]|uniref:hypothetical protein n=1 Tax=Piscinibacter sp. TaxID=1903157 RepID=UPI002ED17F46